MPPLKRHLCRSGVLKEDGSAMPEREMLVLCPHCQEHWVVMQVEDETGRLELRLARRELAELHAEHQRALHLLAREALILARERHLALFVERVLGETSQKKRHQILKTLVGEGTVSFNRFSATPTDQLVELIADHFTVARLTSILATLDIQDPDVEELLGEVDRLQASLQEAQEYILQHGRYLGPYLPEELPEITHPWRVNLNREDGRRLELLAYPQIPKPLHAVNPRSIKGDAWWDTVRFQAYRKHNQHCHACGTHRSRALLKPYLDAHEVYDIDYRTGRVELLEVVALCRACHDFIHAGGRYNAYRNGEHALADLMMVLRRGFKLLQEAGLSPFPGTAEVFAQLLLEEGHPKAREAMERAHKLSFQFQVQTGMVDLKWHDWHLVLDGETHRSPYLNEQHWAAHYQRPAHQRRS